MSDDNSTSRLPVYVRFRDLQSAGIAPNWTTLTRMMAEDDFPCGVMLSQNIRAWPLADVKAWLATRPVERKPVPDRWSRRRAVASA